MALHQIAGRRRAGLGRRPGRGQVRRRQILLALVALTAIAIIGAMGSGEAAAWWAVFAVVVTGGAYLMLLHHARAVAAEREFTSILGPSITDLGTFNDFDLVENSSGSTESDPTNASIPRPTTPGQAWALLCFAFANLGGWLLSPVVFALTLLIGEKPQDTTGQRWLANLQAAQQRLRDQSLRTLAVSAATTASVTAAGTVGFLSGAAGVQPAAAAPMATSAALTTGVFLPGAATGHVTYRIVRGDTLFSISQRFGTTVAALATANHIADPNLIIAGQVITISGATSSRPGDTAGTSGGSATGGSAYTVEPGDTLGAIAARFGTTVSVLAATNNLSDPNLIFPGQVLVVRGHPGAAAPTAARPATQPAPRPTARVAAPIAGATAAAQIAVHTALAQLGKPYQWAGAGPASFDCSGLVMYSWAQAGVYLPHYTVSQYEDTTRISESQLQPGDLVFYDTGDGAQPGHVTIYIGDGQVITADEPGTVIKVVPLTWDGTPMGFGRVR